MKSYELIEAGLKDDGLPVFKFETEMRDGVDLDGIIQIKFAAMQMGDSVCFAISSPTGLLAVFDETDSKRVSKALAEHGEYLVCIDYENRSWSDGHGVGTVLLGRDVGQDVDYRERYQLTLEEQATVVEIADAIDSSHSSSLEK